MSGVISYPRTGAPPSGVLVQAIEHLLAQVEAVFDPSSVLQLLEDLQRLIAQYGGIDNLPPPLRERILSLFRRAFVVSQSGITTSMTRRLEPVYRPIESQQLCVHLETMIELSFAHAAPEMDPVVAHYLAARLEADRVDSTASAKATLSEKLGIAFGIRTFAGLIGTTALEPDWQTIEQDGSGPRVIRDGAGSIVMFEGHTHSMVNLALFDRDSGCAFVVEAKGGGGRWSSRTVPQRLQRYFRKEAVRQEDSIYLELIVELMQAVGPSVKGAESIRQTGKQLAQSLAQGKCFYLGTRCRLTPDITLIHERSFIHGFSSNS